MKSPLKILLLAISILILLPLIAWTGTFLYWHLRITRAVRVLETTKIPNTGGTPQEHQDADQSLMDSGCRCLPYLLRSLDPAKDEGYLSIATFLVAWESVLPGLPITEIDSPELSSRLDSWEIRLGDSEATKKRKIQEIRAWWGEHGEEHHQWWRVWTAECRPFRPPR